MGKLREWEVLHIELARLHQPDTRREAGACCEQPGYKYNVTTTGLACAAERQEAYREETRDAGAERPKRNGKDKRH